MTDKVSKSSKVSKLTPVAQDKDVLQVTAKKGETAELAIAKKFTSPQMTAAGTLLALVPGLKQQGVNAVIAAISGESQQVLNGEMGRAEEMLISQAHVLDTMFSVLTQRAVANMNAGHMNATDTYMRIALKAQSQCRTTLEALSDIKNPRTATFIKQANIAENQQVNNGQAGIESGTPASAHEKTINPRNELLGENHGERLDIRATSKAGGSNSDMEALEAVNRA